MAPALSCSRRGAWRLSPKTCLWRFGGQSGPAAHGEVEDSICGPIWPVKAYSHRIGRPRASGPDASGIGVEGLAFPLCGACDTQHRAEANLAPGTRNAYPWATCCILLGKGVASDRLQSNFLGQGVSVSVHVQRLAIAVEDAWGQGGSCTPPLSSPPRLHRRRLRRKETRQGSASGKKPG